MGNFFEILKHSRNYLTASLATKALAFISIPIYTSLLSTEEYGIVSVFLGVTAIMGSLMAYSTDRSMSRYYFDQKSEDDFKEFVGTSVLLATGCFIINSLLIAYFAESFGELVGLQAEIVYLLIPATLINIVGLTFEQIYGPQKKSKIIAKTSLYRVYLSFGLSILFIYYVKDNKHYAQILGQILGGIIICIYWFRLIKPYIKLVFRRKFLKYVLTYSVPLIPYALSGVIIAQFGKIAIGNQINLSEAGFYNIAAAIGGLVNIIIAVTHQAWNPYYMEYMNEKKYDQIDIDFQKIFKITILFAFFIALFGKEIGVLLAKKEFEESLYLIPFFTVGYIFYQFAYIFLRNFGYSKKTYFMTITVLLSGFVNVALNVVLIEYFAELGAAISFTISYILMTLIGWYINRFHLKMYVPNLKPYLLLIVMLIPFYILNYYIAFIDSNVLLLFSKVGVLGMLSVILIWKDREVLLSLIKSFQK